MAGLDQLGRPGSVGEREAAVATHRQPAVGGEAGVVAEVPGGQSEGFLDTVDQMGVPAVQVLGVAVREASGRPISRSEARN